MKIYTDRFWEFKSKKYPLPYEESVHKKTLDTIEMVVNHGVKINNARILDIGCGTGVFTLPLAEKSHYVIGLDSSKSMIKKIDEEAKKKDLNNVEIVLKSWDEIDVEALHWTKSFDIVWASMTPAIKTVQDLLKMERCSKDWCVYIGWGKKRENSFMEEAFNLHNIKFTSHANAIKVNQILNEMNRNPFVRDFPDSWTWEGTIEEAIEDVFVNLQINEIEPKRDIIKDFVEKHSVNGFISHTTYAEKRLIVWRVADNL